MTLASAHPDAGRLLEKGIFRTLFDFSDFEQRLTKLANTKEVGDAFEILVEGYLHTQPVMQAVTVWLVGQVPLQIRRQLNLPSDSKGIDGIFQTRTGEYVPYQVKYRTGCEVLPYGDVSAFLGVTERSCKDRLIFTNARGLASDIANRDGLRSVRATHLHALTQADFAAIEAWLLQKPIRQSSPEPRGYQREAVQKITETFSDSPRAIAVMACGTGKTLVAMWVAEKLEPKTVLVLVPSLALLSQTLPIWCAESKWRDDLEYLCVCSDPTVSKGVDTFSIRPQDTAFPITTDAHEVRRFLLRETRGVKVVFSTYQSAPVVAEGLAGGKFDFAIFDEAHKTTGPEAGLFSFALADANLPVEKRLFLTATPRHYDIRKRDKEGDFRIVSMDDPNIYGPVAYRLSFAAAAKQGIVCPYKIVISLTTKGEIDAELLRLGITVVRRELLQAQWVATQIALQRAVEATDACKVITFHSRVALAQQFASDRGVGVGQYLDGFEVLHVNGGQSASDRESLLSQFKASSKSVITNARCLTEGVDVPAVDMVAFIDPRRSKVDIAQATGRAMRQSKDTGKTTGYIVVPLFVQKAKGETDADALHRSGFEDVATVVAAMQEQDEDLVDVIRELRQERGEDKPFNPRRLNEKIQIVGPAVDLAELQSAISIEIMGRLGAPWDEMFGRLVKYVQTCGDTVVPRAYTTDGGHRLGMWVTDQRALRVQGKMPEYRRKKLESLPGWSWSLYSSLWEEGYAALQKFVAERGDSLVPARYIAPDGLALGYWVNVQRTHRSTISDERRKRLESLPGWTWDWRADAWERGFEALKKFTEERGHSRVVNSHKTADGYKLGSWVIVQRLRRPNLSEEKQRRLESLAGWTWDKFSSIWEEGFERLKEYQKENGDCRVPQRYKSKDGFGLGAWVARQRRVHASAAKDGRERDAADVQRDTRLQQLDGWLWDASAYKSGSTKGSSHVKSTKASACPEIESA